jgi:hypothetical protein
MWLGSTVDYLPIKCDTLSSNASTTKKGGEKKGKRRKRIGEKRGRKRGEKEKEG